MTRVWSWVGLPDLANKNRRLPSCISMGWEDPPEKEMAPHSSLLAWRIPRTEEPGGLQSMGSQRVRHDWKRLSTAQLHLNFRQMMNTIFCYVPGMGHTYTEKMFSLFICNWNLTGRCVFYMETQIWKSRTQTFKLWDRREADQVSPTRGSWCFTKLPTSQQGSATLCSTVELSCCRTATHHFVE